MYELAKRGFSQGYTYFTWRVHKWELQEYFTELTAQPVVDFFRPNAWPNTPDILPEHLQYGGRPIHVQRLILAATLSANYGMYGPAFELMESEATMPGKEEYARSEKYELKDWDLDADHSLREVIARINDIRRRHPALQQDRTLRFHPTDNDALLAYTKSAPTRRTGAADRDPDVVLVVVNLDPNWKQSGMVHLDVEALGLDADEGYLVHDEFGAAHYLWRGISNYVELDPHTAPAHVFSIRPHMRTERDFPSFA
jgi:starch synthase (maltosyl-transferring)